MRNFISIINCRLLYASIYINDKKDIYRYATHSGLVITWDWSLCDNLRLISWYMYGWMCVCVYACLSMTGTWGTHRGVWSYRRKSLQTRLIKVKLVWLSGWCDRLMLVLNTCVQTIRRDAASDVRCTSVKLSGRIRAGFKTPNLG